MFAPLAKDFYKVGHKDQYPVGTELIYSNFTARSGKLSNEPDSKGIYFVGLQYFVKRFLIENWNDSFFNKPKAEVVNKYQRIVSMGLGYEVDCSHIADLHNLGYLPIELKALPEGSFVKYGVPMLTIKNTLPEFYWVTNMLETQLSAELWLPITSATTFKAFNKTSLKYAELTCDDNDIILFQNHDFSMRGMQGCDAATLSGLAFVLAGSSGTDCIPAILAAEDYYSATGFVAGSVNATEHSVVCAGGNTGELDMMSRLLTEVYPTGILSFVSDSWDFWKVVTYYLPQLKEVIMSRNGKLVVRPDSGDPVDIICGTSSNIICEQKGLIECLWDTFGGTVNAKGFKVLDSHIGAIYGDSITLERQETILRKLADKGFASSNIIFGVGSYGLGYVTRDTHGMAMKSTYAVIKGESKVLQKDPKTDSGTKKSAKGLLMISWANGEYQLNENVTPKQERHGCLETIFKDGKLIKEVTFAEVRERISQL
jgi:nicotinamide phosphoribosyltransferase